ncbi:unnamed protein product [Blepharisma stoltei]|uniref:Uncharacterized protein n=1 Tax=Blepharisma stoltei TaxID=1481888 RepID=A0AAU9KSU6_9CILI|nr:unnamed protein product [Blepharisma stoltei]
MHYFGFSITWLGNSLAGSYYSWKIYKKLSIKIKVIPFIQGIFRYFIFFWFYHRLATHLAILTWAILIYFYVILFLLKLGNLLCSC